jgi:hypothetical protein
MSTLSMQFLPEQRMGSMFGGVDLDVVVLAEVSLGGADRRRENNGEGVQQKTPVALLRTGDAKNA